jgi:paraquat-inducible protein A
MVRVKCVYCDNYVKLENLENGYEYHCPRCDSLVYRAGQSKRVVASLSFATLLVLFWALTSPLLSVYIIDEISLSFYDTLVFLFQRDIFSGVLLFTTIVIIPIMMLLLTLGIIFNKELSLKNETLRSFVRFYLIVKEWNMIEVYFVGLLISMVKLYELADVVILAGFWINVVYVVLLYLSLVLFNPYDVIHIDKRKKINEDSVRIAILFLILAFIFIPASNILPIMPTYKYSVEYPNTILDGIWAFYEEGDIFVPFVIFFASIIIPVLKIVGVSVMILMVRYNIFSNYKKFATKYYIITDALGKYSLLDVYVVVLAASYIQYDDLVCIEIGIAIIPFTLVVIFTMIASKAFDTRLLWRDEKKYETSS